LIICAGVYFYSPFCFHRIKHATSKWFYWYGSYLNWDWLEDETLWSLYSETSSQKKNSKKEGIRIEFSNSAAVNPIIFVTFPWTLLSLWLVFKKLSILQLLLWDIHRSIIVFRSSLLIQRSIWSFLSLLSSQT